MLCNHRTMWKSVFVGVGLFSLMAFGHAYGTTYYTARTGSNSNSCSQATSPSTPRQTISAGINCLSPGDTLYIRGGTYDEILSTDFGTQWPSGTSWSTPVTVAGYPGETVIVKPSGSTNWNVIHMQDTGAYTDTSYRQYIILDNLIIDGSNMAMTVVKLDVGTRRVRIQNSKIIGNSASNGINEGGDVAPTTIARENEVLNTEIYGNAGYGIYFGGDDNIIDGNYIHDNAGYAIHLYAGPGAPNRNIVRNNLLRHNGYSNQNPVGSCALLLSGGDGHVAYNNLIVDHNGCGIQIYSGTPNAKAYNNTVYGARSNCVDIGAGTHGAIVRNNICYNNGGDIFNGGPTDTTIDHNTTNATNPQFVNAAGGDFHLQSASTLIDAGLIISTVTTDIARISRPQGKGYDIGAYEYVGNQLPTPSNLRVTGTQQ